MTEAETIISAELDGRFGCLDGAEPEVEPQCSFLLEKFISRMRVYTFESEL